MSDNLVVTWDAVLSAVAGTVVRGKALTKDTAGKWLLATTANRAVWTGAANVWGVSLTDGSDSQAIRVAHGGLVPFAVIGTLTGSGDYVNVDANAGLVRASAITADTIADYLPNGDIRVQLGYQTGAGTVSGNATGIQGVSVTSADATRSNKLTGDGTVLRFREDMPDFRDWSPAADGATDDSAKLQAFFDAVGSYKSGRLAGSNIYIANLCTIEDATSGGLKGIRIFGDYGEPFTPTARPGLICAVPCPTGAAADITAGGNGGSGQYMQTIALGSGSSAVTVANSDRYIGRRIRLWNTTDKAHTGVFIITSVPSDGVVTIYNPNTGATSTDASDGSIYWRILMPTLRIACREFRIEALSLTAPTGTWGPMLEIGQSPRAGASSVIQWALHRVAFWVDQYTKNPECGLLTAQDIVPRSGNAHYATNGAGVPQVYQTSQVDTGDIYRCAFFGLDNSWKHYSKTGQSKEITCRRTQFAQALRNYGGYGGNGYVIPRETFGAGGTYTVSGSGHVNFENCSFAALSRAIQIGGGTSPVTSITSCMFESTQRIFRSSAGTAQLINFVGCTIHPISTSSKHPSQELFESLDDGPLNFIGCNLMQTDSAGLHGVFTSSSGKRGHMSIVGCWIKGTSGWVGRRGRVTARLCGPYKFTSGDIGTFAVDGGANQNVTVTAANFTSAGLTGVDLNEVTSWQLGRLIDYSLTGAVAWGEYDEAPPVVETSTEGTGGRIEYISGAGGWALVDFPTGVQTGFAQTALSTAYGGWFDCSRSSGSGTEPISMSVHVPPGTIVAPFTYSSTHSPWPATKQFGNVYPKTNYWKSITHTGGTGTGTFTADASTDVITHAASTYGPFCKVQLTTTTTLPGGLAAATDYWVIYQSGTTAKLASSLANAVAGTAINITDAGTGTHTMTVVAGFQTFAWIFDAAEMDATYEAFASIVSETGTPAAGSTSSRLYARTTAIVAWLTTDPGAGNTVTWHAEVMR